MRYDLEGSLIEAENGFKNQPMINNISFYWMISMDINNLNFINYEEFLIMFFVLVS